jgi:hypothetical protein
MHERSFEAPDGLDQPLRAAARDHRLGVILQEPGELLISRLFQEGQAKPAPPTLAQELREPRENLALLCVGRLGEDQEGIASGSQSW